MKGNEACGICTSSNLLKGIDVRVQPCPILQARNKHLVQKLWLWPLFDGMLSHVHQNDILCASLPEVCITESHLRQYLDMVAMNVQTAGEDATGEQCLGDCGS